MVRRSLLLSLGLLAAACGSPKPTGPTPPSPDHVNEVRTHATSATDHARPAPAVTLYRTTAQLPDLDVRALLVIDATKVYAGAASGLFQHDAADDAFKAVALDPASAGGGAVIDLAGGGSAALVVAQSHWVQKLGVAGASWPIAGEQVRAVASQGDGLFIATDRGLLTVTGTAPRVLARGFAATDLAVSASTIFVGTASSGVLRFAVSSGNPESALNLQAGLPTNGVRALSIASDGTTLLVATATAVTRFDAGGHAIGTIAAGIDGLPTDELRAITERAGRTLIGHRIGASVLESGQRTRHYHSLRWIPGEQVTAVALEADGTRWIATASSGVSRIGVATVTFAQQADHYEQFLDQRHWRMDGFVDDSVVFDDPWDLSVAPHQYDKDNDGLWTEMQIGTWCYAYAVTHDERFYDKAHKAVQVMYLQFDIPGETFAAKGLSKGFITRSLVREDEGALFTEKSTMSNWHLQAYQGKNYYWKDDTSSDEYAGHYFGLPLYYDLCAKDEAEKSEVRERLRSSTDYLIANNYWLIKLDGMPTTYGRWRDLGIAVDTIDGCIDNHTLSQCVTARYGGGWLNGTEILGHLLATWHVTGDQKYYDEYERLHTVEKYGRLVPITKDTFTVTDPSVANHSDHELATLAYTILLRYEPNPDRLKIWEKSILDFYGYEKGEHNPWQLATIASVHEADVDLAAGITVLEDLPEDWRDWHYDNSHRRDAHVVGLDRGHSPQFDRVFAYDEIRTSKWNGNPYEVVGGGDGREVLAPTPWLIAYWMMRYYGLLL